MASIPLKSEDSLPPRRGIIFILSAPSGAGKTTISRAALKAIDGLEVSDIADDASAAQGEVDGIDYSFVSEEEFKRRQSSGELAEWARVFESSYGTPRAPLDARDRVGPRHPARHRHPGRATDSRQVSRAMRFRFLSCRRASRSSPERLRGRATEDEAEDSASAAQAREEAEAYPEYDYLIVNAEISKIRSRDLKRS